MEEQLGLLLFLENPYNIPMPQKSHLKTTIYYSFYPISTSTISLQSSLPIFWESIILSFIANVDVIGLSYTSSIASYIKEIDSDPSVSLMFINVWQYYN